MKILLEFAQMANNKLKSQIFISQLIFCVHLDSYKRKIKEMQLNRRLLPLALFFIQFIRKFLCVEPISITIGAAIAGASMFTCRNIFRFSVVFVLFVLIHFTVAFQKTLDTILCFGPACNFTENKLNHTSFRGLFLSCFVCTLSDFELCSIISYI